MKTLNNKPREPFLEGEPYDHAELAGQLPEDYDGGPLTSDHMR